MNLLLVRGVRTCCDRLIERGVTPRGRDSVRVFCLHANLSVAASIRPLVQFRKFADRSTTSKAFVHADSFSEIAILFFLLASYYRLKELATKGNVSILVEFTILEIS